MQSWNWNAADKVAHGAAYHQSFPFAQWAYPLSEQLPVSVTLSQFSPLIPNDLKASTQPVNIQELQVSNPTDKPIEVAFMISVPDISGWELKEPTGVVTKEALAALSKSDPTINIENVILQLVSNGYIQRKNNNPNEFSITSKFLDLNYEEDSRANVDMNVVITESGKFVEVQGTAERDPFNRKTLDELLDLAAAGIKDIIAIQHEVLEVEK